jgi:flagellar motor switch protein FliG
MNAPRPGIRKAAVLVASLETRAADAVLDQMPPARAHEVRQAIMELGELDPREQQQVIDEFFGRRPRPAASAAGSGVELDPGLARKLGLSAAGPAGRPSAPRAEAAPSPARPFLALADAAADRLAEALAAERPQMVALVLSHLTPQQAGAALVRLPAALQAEVVRRLVDLEETDPEILREIEQALEARLALQVTMQRRRVAGVSAVAGILAACQGPTSLRILDTLADFDPALAERLSPPAWRFADIESLDDAALGAVFRAAGEELAELALIGASPSLVRRVLRRLPVEAAAALHERIERPGPVRLADVDAARDEIAAVGQRLAAAGQIAAPRTRLAEAA